MDAILRNLTSKPNQLFPSCQHRHLIRIHWKYLFCPIEWNQLLSLFRLHHMLSTWIYLYQYIYLTSHFFNILYSMIIINLNITFIFVLFLWLFCFHWIINALIYMWIHLHNIQLYITYTSIRVSRSEFVSTYRACSVVVSNLLRHLHCWVPHLVDLVSHLFSLLLINNLINQ
jgi:hypothetical protein